MAADKNGKTGAIVFAALLLLGAGILIYGAHEIFKAHQARRWTQVPAQINNVRVEHDDEGFASYSVQYQYTIAGQSYRGNRIAFGYNSNSSGDAKFSRMHTGDTVTIFVDPSDPSESVLCPGEVGGLPFIIAVGGIVFVIGLNAFLFQLVRLEPIYRTSSGLNRRPRSSTIDPSENKSTSKM